MTLDPDRHYFRNPAASAVTVANRVLFVQPGAEALSWSAVDADVVADLWATLAEPVPGAELARRLAGQPDGVARLVDALVAGTFVIRGTPEDFATWGPEPPAATGSRPCRHLVVGVTGAVQAVFVPAQLRRLAVEFADRIDVVLSTAAREFLHARALTALGFDVWSDPFEERGEVRVPHAHLAAAADLVVVLPATADALFRLAHGAAADLLSLVVAATRAPVVVVPSMHPSMWHHPAVRRNVTTLRRDGVFVLEPGPAFSVGEGATRQIGGAGLGQGGANLTSALAAILQLSR